MFSFSTGPYESLTWFVLTRGSSVRELWKEAGVDERGVEGGCGWEGKEPSENQWDEEGEIRHFVWDSRQEHPCDHPPSHQTGSSGHAGTGALWFLALSPPAWVQHNSWL